MDFQIFKIGGLGVFFLGGGEDPSQINSNTIITKLHFRIQFPAPLDLVQKAELSIWNQGKDWVFLAWKKSVDYGFP